MTHIDPPTARAHLLGQGEIFVAVQKGLKNRRVLPALRSYLSPLAKTFTVSRSVDEHPKAPHLIVLVGGWDKLSALQAVKACRARMVGCPTRAVLVGKQGDVAELFAAGVSDCVRWPVTKTELTARIRARLEPAAAESAAELALDPRHLTIRCNDVRASLTPKEFKVVAQLIQNSGQWMSSKELLTAALGETRIDTTRVRFHVFGIRKKLRHEAWRLRSHRTLGYCFELS